MKSVNIDGMQFGRLTILGLSKNPKRKRERYWDCICNCGNTNIIVVSTNKLTSGHTSSCGCLREEVRGQSSKKYNSFDFSNGYGIGTANDDKTFLFDIEDFDKIKDLYWHIDKNEYVCNSKSTNGKSKKIYMHKIIMNFEDSKQDVDHKNRDKSDNRKENLRPATSSQNGYNQKISKNNKSGFIGVFFANREQRWIAKIKNYYKSITLGSFDNIEDAIVARLKAEKEICGDFAPQRHLFETYNI